MMAELEQLQQVYCKTEADLLDELRNLRRGVRAALLTPAEAGKLTLGQRVADLVAATMGSWGFIIIQSIILCAWIAANVMVYFQHWRWDAYPFILLNLVLSFQAAYAAPIIMMSQNRQADIDRCAAEGDHQVNLKAELEVEALHQKIDKMREEEFLYLSKAVLDLTALLKNSGLLEDEVLKAAATRRTKTLPS